MIGTGELQRATLVVATHRHTPPMSARIEQDIHTTLSVTGQQHRIRAHPRREELTRRRHLRGMTHKQPAPRKQILQLTVEKNRSIGEDFATDLPAIDIDETTSGRVRTA